MLARSSRWLCGWTASRRWASSLISNGIVRSPFPDIDIPRQHVFDYVWKEGAEQHPNKIALVDGANGRELTFRDGRTESLCAAAAFRDALGLNKADVVALHLPNCPEYVTLFMGAAAAGVVVTTVSPAHTVSEVARQLVMSGATVVATTDNSVPKIKEAIAKMESRTPLRIVSVGAESHSRDVLSYSKLITSARAADGPCDDFDFEQDVVVLPYSSGTTGVPKGVMLTHKNLVSNGRQMVYAQGADFIRKATASFQSVTVCVLPLFHIFGMNVTCFPVLHAGGKFVAMPAFEPKSFVQAMEKHKPTFLHTAPPLMSFLATSPQVTSELLSSLDYVMTGAAPLGKALFKLFKSKAPSVVIREGWGMTELSPVGTLTPHSDEVAGSCGVLIPNTLAKLVDADNNTVVQPGQKGELCIRGPQVMRGYLNDLKSTRGTIDPEGWLHTGDVATFDETGHFYIVDRIKELIKVKGYQVAPAELENLLRGHPSVSDVAVIGVSHPKLGQAPRAYVVANGSVSAEDLHAHVQGEVAEYKRLTGGVAFVDVIPKSAAGKILRKDLVAAYQKESQGA